MMGNTLRTVSPELCFPNKICNRSIADLQRCSPLNSLKELEKEVVNMPGKTLKPLFQTQLLSLRPGNAIYYFAAEQQLFTGELLLAVARVVP